MEWQIRQEHGGLPPLKCGFEGNVLSVRLCDDIKVQRGLRNVPVAMPELIPERELLSRIKAYADGACL